MSQSITTPLFLIYINNLHAEIKHFELHRFPDDTNLPKCNDYVGCINKQLSYDQQCLEGWLKVNKNFDNIDKTELLLYTSPKKHPLG